MTNLEMLSKKGMITVNTLFSQGDSAGVNIVISLRGKDFLSFSNKEDISWLLEEHKETIKLTLHEKCILESLPDKYNYISRDEGGKLYVYNTIPKKLTNELFSFGEYCDLRVFSNMFEFIKWGDNMAYKIEDILNNCEVVENVD